ncbi:unnamed protein product [Owenia fusiformis]|uniref:Uncharacterized protein n=1 Tax=Owenia fusiformis TaxID=6347 RepID=A0A8S4NCH9_OWEFU|nr:unnamed protein product [Owenia fusiformis]
MLESMGFQMVMVGDRKSTCPLESQANSHDIHVVALEEGIVRQQPFVNVPVQQTTFGLPLEEFSPLFSDQDDVPMVDLGNLDDILNQDPELYQEDTGILYLQAQLSDVTEENKTLKTKLHEIEENKELQKQLKRIETSLDYERKERNQLYRKISKLQPAPSDQQLYRFQNANIYSHFSTSICNLESGSFGSVEAKIDAAGMEIAVKTMTDSYMLCLHLLRLDLVLVSGTGNTTESDQPGIVSEDIDDTPDLTSQDDVHDTPVDHEL